MYLHECSFLPPNNVDHVAGDAQHGRESQQRSDEMSPPRILVVEVSQRRELNQAEYEHALKRNVTPTSNVTVVYVELNNMLSMK